MLRESLVSGLLAILVVATTSLSASASTLSDVRNRGVLQCGVSQNLPGFAALGKNEDWQGFDVDFCRAVAAAIFGDGSKVKFTATTADDRFKALRTGKIDLLSRNTAWTETRDTQRGMLFAGISYYDGQGFMINAKKLPGVNSALQLSGASICILAGTTSQLDVADYFKSHKMPYTLSVFDSTAKMNVAYDSGACDVYTGDHSGLYATRLSLKNPDDNVILPEIISNEPLGPLVRQGDDQWFNLVKWTLNAMILAEELGITRKNVDQMKKSDDPEIRRVLGQEPRSTYGKGLGVGEDWVADIVSQVGNYGESFDRNLGKDSPLKISRGLNRLWNKGGILYAPPIR